MIIDFFLLLICKDSWLYDNLASLIGSSIAFIGFIIAIIQLKRNVRTLQADLSLKLDDRISIHRNLYREFFEGGKYYHSVPKSETERVEFYLTFYDTASLLVQNKKIEIRQVNSLYGYRFMCVMHNKDVQKIINSKIKSWSGLLWLYKKIFNYRLKYNQEIPRKENKYIVYE